jgi:hypothetical protein
MAERAEEERGGMVGVCVVWACRVKYTAAAVKKAFAHSSNRITAVLVLIESVLMKPVRDERSVKRASVWSTAEGRVKRSLVPRDIACLREGLVMRERSFVQTWPVAGSTKGLKVGRWQEQGAVLRAVSSSKLINLSFV